MEWGQEEHVKEKVAKTATVMDRYGGWRKKRFGNDWNEEYG